MKISFSQDTNYSRKEIKKNRMHAYYFIQDHLGNLGASETNTTPSSENLICSNEFIDLNLSSYRNSILDSLFAQDTSISNIEFYDKGIGIGCSSKFTKNLYNSTLDYYINSNIALLYTQSESLSNKEFYNKGISINHSDKFTNEKKTLGDELQENEKEVNLIITKVKQELLLELKYFSIYSDEFSGAERKIIEIEEKYGFRVLGEVLQSICIEHYGEIHILSGVCQSLARYNSNDVAPWGTFILINFLNHKSDVVKEYAISLLESWGDSSLLSVLKNTSYSQNWMKEYIQDVIKQLEK